MANRLKKLADVSYAPGTPGQAYQPAYCTTEAYTTGGYITYSGGGYIYNSDPSSSTYGEYIYIPPNASGYVFPQTAYREICYPAQPYIAPVPATTTYTAITGWNGGAHSVAQIEQDGYFEFQASEGNHGIAVGLSSTDISQLPSEVTHGLYFSGTTVSVIESGAVVDTMPGSHAYATVYRIERRGLTVTYSAGAWSYTSLVPSSGAVFADAAFYASGDFVDNPEIGALSYTGQAYGTLGVMLGAAYGRDVTTEYTGMVWDDGLTGSPGTDGIAGNSATASLITELRVIGRIDALTNPLQVGDIIRVGDNWYTVTGAVVDHGSYLSVPVVYGGGTGVLPADGDPVTMYVDQPSNNAGAYASASGVLAAMTGDAGAVFVTHAAGSMMPLAGVASDRPYTYGAGSLLPLVGTADGGYPEVSIITGYGIIGSMLGAATGLTGEVGSAAGTLAPLGGFGSDYVYCEARGTLPMPYGYADSGWPVENERYENHTLLFGDFFTGVSQAAYTMTEGLTLTDEFVGTLLAEGVIYDALNLTDTLTVQQALEAIITSTLYASNDLTGSVRIDLPGGMLPGEPLQYAVNVLTGAMTTYSGFGFDAYARSGQLLYGCKPDGVYRVRRGNDAGDYIQGHVDFGGSDYESTANKTVESVYLGLTTDGTITARLTADGVERLYRVVQRGPISRAVGDKGVAGRIWGVALEIVDATEFEMDMLEVQVGLTTGRWRSR